MKNFITILIMLVAFGCGKSPEEKLVGTYETKKDEDGNLVKLVLLENGKYESWAFGKKRYEGSWKIVEKEVHVGFEGFTEVFKIEQNGDLTFIAYIENGKRRELQKEVRSTFKKLKE